MPGNILYGTPGSLYTGKVRCYLRKQRIEFEERSAGDPRFRAEVVPAVGRWIIPVLQTPEGEFVQDGADIIDHFESRGLARLPAYPATPVHLAVSRLFELFGGEGLLRPAMHYRWNFDATNLAFLCDDFCAGLAAPGSSAEEKAAVFARSSGAMRKATSAFGVTADTAPLVEASYLDFLARLDAHLAHAPYLLGGHPTIGDYGLIAPMYAHLGRDPYPAMLMKQLAPRVWRWVERMNAPEQAAGEYADARETLFADDAVPASLLSLLRFVAEDYLPELQAHMDYTNNWLAARPEIAAGHNGLEKPGTRAIGMATFVWRGAQIRTAVMPYRQYLLQRLQDACAAIGDAERARVRAVFSDAGLAPFLDLKALRRVERHRHLEVWGPAPGGSTHGAQGGAGP
jgi:glutathione S-transferase